MGFQLEMELLLRAKIWNKRLTGPTNRSGYLRSLTCRVQMTDLIACEANEVSEGQSANDI